MRHPRPLTAADLHLLLEQEQEGIVSLPTLSEKLLAGIQSSRADSNVFR
jgi:hypothetical protein